VVIVTRSGADLAADGMDGTSINVVLGGHIRMMADGKRVSQGQILPQA
jgi:hypothetical protein